MLRGVIAKLEGFAKQEEVVRNEEGESFEGFKFFMPSTRLAEALMQQNQQLVSEYVDRNSPPGYEANETESENGSLLGRLGLEALRSPDAIDQERQTRVGKRLISERLYHYLSSLAETPRALEGGAFPLWEYLPDGMATMLGLSAYRTMPQDSLRAVEIRQLLERVTTEFRNWLVEKQNGSFVTPWIEIAISGDDDLRLTAIEESQIVETAAAGGEDSQESVRADSTAASTA